MRIGFFTDRYYPQTDGVGVSIDMFARDLEALGHTVYILCPKGASRSRHSKHNHADHQDGPNVIRFPSIPGIWFEGYRDTFPWTPKNMKMIQALDLDIIHIHTPGQMGMLGIYAAKSFDLPLVATYHTDYVAYSRIYKRVFPGAIALSFLLPIMARDKAILKDARKVLWPERTIPQWNAKIGKHMITVMHNTCDLVIAVSEKSRKQLLGYRTQAPIRVLPTGIDWDEISLATTYDLRKEFSLDSNDTILLYLGRIGEEKNLQLAIRALPHILTSEPNTHLVLAGPASNVELTKFQDLAASLKVLDRIIFTGVLTRSQAMGAFATSDIFVFPSVTDTQGLVMGEAAAHGKPIVFVDDQISEIAQDHKTGLRAKNHPKDFALKCLKLIQDKGLRTKFGTESKKVAHNLSARNQAARLQDLYSELLEDK